MNLTVLVSAMGIAQIVSWGTLFYAIGVLGAPMRAELGVSELFLFGSFTAGLLVSGAFSPKVGRAIDRQGGRLVLSAGSIVGAASMALLAVASHPAILLFGWLTAGASMAATLYDPAFATLSQHTGARYRKAVTALTLFGGFASTVFWPLSHLLLEAWGWRLTFAIYAGLNLFVCLPIHLFLVPRHSQITRTEGEARAATTSPGLGDRRLPWLTAGFALGSFVAGVVGVHLVSLLTTAGLTTAQAVSISMLMGPMQVAGRIVEMGLSRRVKAVTAGFASFVLLLLALLALVNVEGFGIAAIFFVAAYGCGNGVFTLVRGTVPAEIYGQVGLGGLLGHMSRFALYARAVAPGAFSALVTFGFTRNAALSTLAALAVAGLASYRVGTRVSPDSK